MTGSLFQRGYLLPEDLKYSPGFPSETRMNEGPVAVIECIEDIPCDPCEEACPYNAITIGESITNLPRLHEDRCIGCGMCLSACPGLAIFLLDLTFSEDTSTVSFCYEYLPLPQENDIVSVVDRAGKIVGAGKILRVKNLCTYDRTPVITVEVDDALAQQVRSIARSRDGWGGKV